MWAELLFFSRLEKPWCFKKSVFNGNIAQFVVDNSSCNRPYRERASFSQRRGEQCSFFYLKKHLNLELSFLIGRKVLIYFYNINSDNSSVTSNCRSFNNVLIILHRADSVLTWQKNIYAVTGSLVLLMCKKCLQFAIL